MAVGEQNKSGEVDMQEVKMTGLKGKHGGRREEVSGIHIIRHHILISNRKARKPNRQVYPKLDQRHLEIPVPLRVLGQLTVAPQVPYLL